jgi:MFS family permease
MRMPHRHSSHYLPPGAAIPVATVDLIGVQRRTLRVLFATQIIGGIGVGIGGSVGALLAAELAGISVSGLSQGATVVGAALLAFPATYIVNRRGRRPSLAASYFVAALGSIVIVIAATQGPSAIPLLLGGFFLSAVPPQRVCRRDMLRSTSHPPHFALAISP